MDIRKINCSTDGIDPAHFSINSIKNSVKLNNKLAELLGRNKAFSYSKKNFTEFYNDPKKAAQFFKDYAQENKVNVQILSALILQPRDGDVKVRGIAAPSVMMAHKKNKSMMGG